MPEESAYSNAPRALYVTSVATYLRLSSPLSTPFKCKKNRARISPSYNSILNHSGARPGSSAPNSRPPMKTKKVVLVVGLGWPRLDQRKNLRRSTIPVHHIRRGSSPHRLKLHQIVAARSQSCTVNPCLRAFSLKRGSKLEPLS